MILWCLIKVHREIARPCEFGLWSLPAIGMVRIRTTKLYFLGTGRETGIIGGVLFVLVLGLEPRTSCMLSTNSTTELQPWPKYLIWVKTDFIHK